MLISFIRIRGFSYYPKAPMTMYLGAFWAKVWALGAKV